MLSALSHPYNAEVWQVAKLSSERFVAKLQLLLAAAPAVAQSSHEVRYPDGRIQVQLRVSDRVYYSVSAKGKPLLRGSTLSMRVDQRTLGLDPKIENAKTRTVNREIEVPVPRKSARVHESFNELRLDMKGNYAVVFRAYDEGVAYRIETSLPQSEIKIYNEEAQFRFAGDYKVYYPKEDSFFSHNEREFPLTAMKGIGPTMISSLPAVVDAEGIKVAIAESDIDDYPGLWLRGGGTSSCPLNC